MAFSLVSRPFFARVTGILRQSVVLRCVVTARISRSDPVLVEGRPNDALPSAVGRWSATLCRLARNAAIDTRFGWPLGAVYLHSRSQNSDYRLLEETFEDRIRDGEVLVDVGCGTGRVLNHWLRVSPKSRMYGLESDSKLAALTKFRLRRRPNVTILTGDAVDNLPPTGTLFFLFNPFGEETVARLSRRLSDLRQSDDHEILVIYSNCKHVRVFVDDPGFDVQVLSAGEEGAVREQDVALITRRRI